MSELNPTKQKILLLLLGGLTFSLTRSPGQYWRILGKLRKGWKQIKEAELKLEIRKLYRSRLIGTKSNHDGTLTLILTEKGRQKALRYNLDNMKISPHHWDGKWRVVIFDIPEKRRNARDALRNKLKNLGFHELQKSVFVYPFHCKDEIDFIVELFDLRPHVRYGTFDSIDNDLHLRNIFKNLI